MTGILLAIAFIVSQGQQAPPQPLPQPRPNPCAAPEFRHFDFWIGGWTVRNPQGAHAGTNRIESIAGGCGIQESWVGATGSSGRSLNTWQQSDGKWHQVWVGAGGGLLHLIGGLVNGRMVLEGETRGANNVRTLQRMTWTPLPDGRVRQFWETSTDEGKTWAVAFDGYYTRRPLSH